MDLYRRVLWKPCAKCHKLMPARGFEGIWIIVPCISFATCTANTLWWIWCKSLSRLMMLSPTNINIGCTIMTLHCQLRCCNTWSWDAKHDLLLLSRLKRQQSAMCTTKKHLRSLVSSSHWQMAQLNVLLSTSTCSMTCVPDMKHTRFASALQPRRHATGRLQRRL